MNAAMFWFWRTARFRQTLIYGAGFAAILIAMLAFIYLQTAGYLGRQVDQIIAVETSALRGVAPEGLPRRIDEDIARDPRHVDILALFANNGAPLAGNLRTPPALPLDGAPHELHERGNDATDARALALRLADGRTLIVGRDITQLAEFRRIILRALIWSGLLVLFMAIGLGVGLSLHPLRRIREIAGASTRIIGGALDVRLPIAGNRDELDRLAIIVNAMMDQIERLVDEAKSVGDVIAHDLRTPLTRLRFLLQRLSAESEMSEGPSALLDQALAEVDQVLSRFQAVLRISEIESHNRRAGFAEVDLRSVVEQAEELYRPLAEDRGLLMQMAISETTPISADPELLFEALANLIDNAIKFTPIGGRIDLRVLGTALGPELQVTDTGPGIPAGEIGAVTHRFYRSQRDQNAPGSGLGLSIVGAIAQLHGFTLTLEDARPGLRASLKCWPRMLEAAAPR
jgi:signal transduction histidine kinase